MLTSKRSRDDASVRLELPRVVEAVSLLHAWLQVKTPEHLPGRRLSTSHGDVYQGMRPT